VDLLGCQPDVRRCRNLIPFWSKVGPLTLLRDFAPLLGRVVLIGETGLAAASIAVSQPNDVTGEGSARLMRMDSITASTNR
jgi:hypothetical protein